MGKTRNDQNEKCNRKIKIIFKNETNFVIEKYNELI